MAEAPMSSPPKRRRPAPPPFEEKRKILVITSMAGDALGSFVLTSGSTVDVLKTRLQAITGIPKAEQQLIFNEEELLTTKALRDGEVLGAVVVPETMVDVSMIRRPAKLARILELVLAAPLEDVRGELLNATAEARTDRGIVFAAVSKVGSALQNTAA